jgi:chorismate mutase
MPRAPRARGIFVPPGSTGPAMTEERTDMNATAMPDTHTADDRITDLRRRIDEIDQELIQLWRERAAISQEVGATRVAAGGTRLVLAREQEILARFREALGEDGTQLAMLILRAGRGRLV